MVDVYTLFEKGVCWVIKQATDKISVRACICIYTRWHPTRFCKLAEEGVEEEGAGGKGGSSYISSNQRSESCRICGDTTNVIQRSIQGKVVTVRYCNGCGYREVIPTTTT
jgi:hypothetical protein